MKNQVSRIYHKFHRVTVVLLIITIFLSPLTVFGKISNDPNALQWAYADTKVYEAWDITTGSPDVVVAVIDNGFDLFHPDIYENVWKNTREVADNGIDDDGNGYKDDVWGWNFAAEDLNHNGEFDDEEKLGNNDPRPSVFSIDQTAPEKEVVHHGTLVAGIIGAVGDNSEEGSGINWKVKMMSVKVIGNSGTGELGRLPEAIHYAVDNGAHVINLSMVGSIDPRVKDAIKYAYDHGVVVVAAAGNDMVNLDATVRYPICADAKEGEQWVLGVSAIRESHRIASFSNTGATCVDITAPGVNIASTLRYAPDYGLTEKYGGGWNGTSFAAPHVSGAAALIKSIHPSWGAKEIYNAILTTTYKTPPQDENEYARLFGKGLLQIDKAVEYAKSVDVADEAVVVPAVIVEKESISVMHALHLVRKKNAAIVERLLAQEKFPPLFGITAIQEIAAGVWHDAPLYVLVEPTKKSLARVRVRVEDGTEIFGWNLLAKGPVQVVVRDVYGDRAPEIIVAPRYSDTKVYTVYSLEGVEIDHYSLDKKHDGVAIDVTKDNHVVALYREGKGISIHDISPEKELVSVIPVADVRSVGSLRLLSNGNMAVSAGKNELPYLFILAPNGIVERRVLAADKKYKDGLTITIGDYNDDGEEDIATLPTTGGLPLRVWNGTLEKITEKKVLKDTGGYLLLPVFE